MGRRWIRVEGRFGFFLGARQPDMVAEDRFDFFLGTHLPEWLWHTSLQLFVSRRRLSRVKRLNRRQNTWALDSGGFSELSLYGKWTIHPRLYVSEVRRYRDEIGCLDFAASMDWMCEPRILTKTGKTVREHQRRTIDNYLELTALAPELPWLPVLQGWEIEDYLRHAEDYATAGVKLCHLRRVGVGSVCRRQNTGWAVELMKALHKLGLSLHAFGYKLEGLRGSLPCLASADSMAWSAVARRDRIRLPGCAHLNCQNCLKYARKWFQERILPIITAECMP